MVRYGFLGAKAPLRPGFAKDAAFFSAKAQKLKNSAKQNSWDSLPVSCFAAFAILVCQRHCVFLCKGTKAAKSCAFCVIRRSRILGIVCRGFVEGSCWGFPLFLILLKVFPSLLERRCGSVQYFCHILQKCKEFSDYPHRKNSVIFFYVVFYKKAVPVIIDFFFY